MLITTLAFATLLLQDPTAPAAPSAQAAPATAPNEEPDDGVRLVCRRDRVVGSNLPERVCLPQREWDRMREVSRTERDRFNDRPRFPTAPHEVAPGS